MTIDRRGLLKLISGSVTANLLSRPVVVQAEPKAKPIKAVVFDGFVIFDPKPIFELAETLFPEQGKALGQLWFAKIFSYTWLRTVGGRYKNFYVVIAEALVFSAESLKLEISSKKQNQMMDVWTNLKIWPDVKSALQQLRKKDIRLGFLSNLTEEMLRVNAKNSGIEDDFEFYLSTDKVQAYKPSPLAYQMGVDALNLPKESIVFAAFGGWDAAGAQWFGYPTVWINRLGVPIERLDFRLGATGKGIEPLINFVLPNANR